MAERSGCLTIFITYMTTYVALGVAIFALFEPITSLAHYLLVSLGYFQSTAEGPLAWSTGTTFRAFPIPLPAIGGLLLVLIAVLIVNGLLFRRRRPAARFAFLITERLSILLGFGIFAIYYGQFHVLQTYYYFMVYIPSVWNLGEGWVRWFIREDVIETTWWRVVAILGASVALWYAFAPVPRTFQVLWLIMRPYWVTRLGYWNLRDRVERAMGRSGECDLVIASDLHIESGRGTLEGGLDCGVIFPWQRWVIATSRAKGLLLLGDITDTGDRNAWHRAADFFLEVGVERAVVPGNHDIHFKRIADHSPDLTWLGNWRSVLSNFGASENSFDATTVRAQIDAVEGQPRGSSFPRLHRYGHLPVDVLLLDSNTRPSGWPVTNAIGLVGRAQLSDARRLLAGRDPTRVLLIALHHHIIPPVSVAAPLLVCVDYLEILALAAECGAEAIAHGHTHMPYVCTLRYKTKHIRIISCGSPLFAPGGPLAEIIRYPSCFGLKLDGGRLKDPVLLFSRTPDTAATQVGHRGRRPRRKRRSP